MVLGLVLDSELDFWGAFGNMVLGLVLNFMVLGLVLNFYGPGTLWSWDLF